MTSYKTMRIVSVNKGKYDAWGIHIKSLLIKNGTLIWFETEDLIDSRQCKI